MSEGQRYQPPAVRAAVAAVTGDGGGAANQRTVDAVDPIPEGHNETVAVTFEDGSEAVLKVGTRDPDRFPVEGRMLRFVSEWTDVPAPQVLGGVDRSSAGPLEHPFVVLSRPRGETYECDPHSVGRDSLACVCAEAGRNLALLHEATAGAPDAFGALGPVGPPDAMETQQEGGADAAAVAGVAGVGVVDPHESWPALFRGLLAYSVEQLAGTRFDDLRDDLEPVVDRLVAELESVGADPTPVVGHLDYRLGNLLLTPAERPVTRSVIDWGGVAACDPGYDLVKTEAMVADWPDADAAVRDRLVERLYDGYATVRGDPRDDAFAARRRIYRVQTRLHFLRHFEAVTAQFSDRVSERAAADNRAALRAVSTD